MHGHQRRLVTIQAIGCTAALLLLGCGGAQQRGIPTGALAGYQAPTLDDYIAELGPFWSGDELLLETCDCRRRTGEIHLEKLQMVIIPPDPEVCQAANVTGMIYGEDGQPITSTAIKLDFILPDNGASRMQFCLPVHRCAKQYGFDVFPPDDLPGEHPYWECRRAATDVCDEQGINDRCMQHGMLSDGSFSMVTEMIGTAVLQVQIPGTDRWARANFELTAAGASVAYRLKSEVLDFGDEKHTVYDLEPVRE